MAADRSVPPSLQRRLGDAEEIAIFEEWQRTGSSPIHPILSSPDKSSYESQRAAFVQRQPYQSVLAILFRFHVRVSHDISSDLESYITVCANNDSSIPTTDFRQYTWQDALEQAQAAEREYNRRDANSPRRSWMRSKGSSLARDLAPLKDLFPEDHGLNIIAGGLSLIFRVSVSCFDTGSRKGVTPF